jgi:gas vesicle protein
MAGILDKIKGMFGGKKAEADPAAATADAGDSKLDDIKETAGEVKDKVDDLVEKAGDKVPDQVKDAYEKVSDKVEDIIPGDKDNDGH